MKLRYDSDFSPITAAIDQIKKEGLITEDELRVVSHDLPEVFAFQLALLFQRKIYALRQTILQEQQGLPKINLQAQIGLLEASLAILNLAMNLTAHLSACSLIFK